MSDRMLPISKVAQAIEEAHVNRIEYSLTQADCHKRGCKCSSTGNGRPEDALKLVKDMILEHVRDLYATGKTRHEIAMEHAAEERNLFEEWKRSRKVTDE